jgi:hypothetical protein
MNNVVNKDLEHLKILSILFYVLAGLCLFPVLFGILYMVMGVSFGAIMMSSDIPHKAGDPPPEIFGAFFVVFGAIFSVVFLAFGILALKAGRNLAKKQGYTFAFVTACIVCLWMPLGTILGVFTIIVLMRDSVKQLFDGVQPSQGFSPPNWK